MICFFHMVTAVIVICRCRNLGVIENCRENWMMMVIIQFINLAGFCFKKSQVDCKTYFRLSSKHLEICTSHIR